MGAIVESLIEALVSDGLATATVDIAHLRTVDGYNNTLVMLRRDRAVLAAKLFTRKRDDPAERCLAEYEALAALFGKNVGPEPLWADTSCTRLPIPCLVYEWLEGASLEGRPIAPEQVPELLELMILLGGHGESVRVERDCLKNPKGPADLLSSILERLATIEPTAEKTGFPGPAILSLLQRAVSDAAETAAAGQLTLVPRRLCHGDPSLANVIELPDGRLRLIDWEYSGMGDPCFELADLFHHPKNDAIAMAARKAVQAGLLLHSETDRHRFAAYDRILPLRWAVLCFHQAQVRSLSGDVASPEFSPEVLFERGQVYLHSYFGDSA